MGPGIGPEVAGADFVGSGDGEGGIVGSSRGAAVPVADCMARLRVGFWVSGCEAVPGDLVEEVAAWQAVSIDAMRVMTIHQVRELLSASLADATCAVELRRPLPPTGLPVHTRSCSLRPAQGVIVLPDIAENEIRSLDLECQPDRPAGAGLPDLGRALHALDAQSGASIWALLQRRDELVHRLIDLGMSLGDVAFRLVLGPLPGLTPEIGLGLINEFLGDEHDPILFQVDCQNIAFLNVGSTPDCGRQGDLTIAA